MYAPIKCDHCGKDLMVDAVGSSFWWKKDDDGTDHFACQECASSGKAAEDYDRAMRGVV